MQGAKELDGKRVRLTRNVHTEKGDTWAHGTEGTFRKVGVVRCLFERDDGQRLSAGHMKRKDFEIVDGN